MQLNALYFAHVRQRVGLSSETLELPDGSTVADARAHLFERYPSLLPLGPVLRTAVDGEFVGDDTVLHDGCELVLIPPVAGGSDPPPIAAQLSDAPVSLEPLADYVCDDTRGALVTFTGIVRNHARGHAVERLHYEAYGSMAVRQLRRLVHEVETTVPGTRVAVHHRVGTLAVGDIAVVIAAASAHRGEAFRACQLLIDRLKEDVPIWKRETGPDGAEWVSDRP